MKKPFDTTRERQKHIPQPNEGALDLEGKRDKGNIMGLLFGDTFIQGTPLFRGHKIWSQKNFYIIFVSVTSIEGSLPFRGKGHIVWVTPLHEKKKHSQNAFTSHNDHRFHNMNYLT